KAANIAILVDKLKLSAREAERTYELLLDPAFGFTPDAAFDREGFKNVLALRAELERKAGADVPPPERYVDLAYYDRGMMLVGRWPRQASPVAPGLAPLTASAPLIWIARRPCSSTASGVSIRSVTAFCNSSPLLVPISRFCRSASSRKARSASV